MSKMWNLSRNAAKEAIWEELRVEYPVRHRWLQEHPRSAEILNELTSNVVAMQARGLDRRASTSTGYWTTMAETDDDVLGIAVMLELGSDEVWVQMEDQFPREPAKRTALDVMHDLMGDVVMVPQSSGPSAPDSHRGG